MQPQSHSLLLHLALTLALSLASAAQAGPENGCPVPGCDLLADGAYAGVLIGRLGTLLNGEQSRQLLHAAQARGRWAGLPAGAQQFSQHIQPVTLRIPSGVDELRVIALMSAQESQAISLQTGDLVRFQPHPAPDAATGPMTRPGEDLDLAYWNAIGCIAVLCRASDQDCQNRYLQGAWRPADGQPIDPLSATPLPGGPHIDPMTYLPGQTGRTP